MKKQIDYNLQSVKGVNKMLETVFIIISVVLLLGLAIPQLLWLIDINKEVKIYTEKKEK